MNEEKFEKTNSEEIIIIEEKEKKNREQDAKKRKVWVPVGMLGGLMLVILFI